MTGKRKYIQLVAAWILLILCAGISVNAEETGSINIKLSDIESNGSKEGVVFGYTKITSVNQDGTYEETRYTKGIQMQELRTAVELEEAAATIAKRIKTSDGQVATDKNGEAIIKNLEPGVYLLSVLKNADYEMVEPFLVMIPMWNEVSESMEYNVTVIPKHSKETGGHPLAPQTNLNDDYKERMMIAGICALGTILLLIFFNRKGCDEEIM